MALRVASFLPFQTTYYLNGHSFIEQELKRAGIGFRKHDNAFLAVDDVAALQAAADRLSPEIIRRRLDYWTLILGPKFSKKERARLNLSRFYAISQIEYCRNFIFKRHFPIHKLFERSCEIGLWRLSADKIATIFRQAGQSPDAWQAGHGRRPDRARPSRLPRHFKSGFLKQYEKFLTFLRNELVSNNLTDFGLLKGLDHLDAVRTTFQAITDRFAGFQAEWLNVHVDFPLLQRLAHPITIGAVRYPGLKIHEPRIIRLFEVLLHGGPQIGGWTTRQVHRAVLTSFDLSEKAYRLNQLRYDLRKLKGHGLIERDGSRLTPTGSHPRASKSPCSSSSSISACVGRSPTAASITGRTRITVPTAGSKPPITAPTPRSNGSSTSWRRPDLAIASIKMFELVLSIIGRARIYAFPQTPLWKSGPCGAVPRRQGVATGQHSPGSRYARLQWRSVFGTMPGERVMSDGLKQALPRIAERQLRLCGPHLDPSDRIVLNAYFGMGHSPGGFRVWWRGSDDTLDNAHLMRLAGRFSRRVRGYAKAHDIPVIDCVAGERKHAWPTIIWPRQWSPKVCFWSWLVAPRRRSGT